MVNLKWWILYLKWWILHLKWWIMYQQRGILYLKWWILQLLKREQDGANSSFLKYTNHYNKCFFHAKFILFSYIIHHFQELRLGALEKLQVRIHHFWCKTSSISRQNSSCLVEEIINFNTKVIRIECKMHRVSMQGAVGWETCKIICGLLACMGA